MRSVLVNRDPEQYRGDDDEYDLALLDFLIGNFLLGPQRQSLMPRWQPICVTPSRAIAQHSASVRGRLAW